MDRRLGQDGLPSGTDMKYAHIDENNQIIGWYSSDVHDNIPEPNIEVSEEQWQTAIDNAHNKINQDGSTETADFRSQEEIDQWNYDGVEEDMGGEFINNNSVFGNTSANYHKFMEALQHMKDARTRLAQGREGNITIPKVQGKLNLAGLS